MTEIGTEVEMADATELAAPGPAEKIYTVDQRAWVRLPCHQEVTCQPRAASSKVFLAARVQNISGGGVGILLDRRFALGTELTITFSDREGAKDRTLVVRVVHDTLVTASPGLRWLMGCEFLNPLSEEEVQALL